MAMMMFGFEKEKYIKHSQIRRNGSSKLTHLCEVIE
jgi:hypothetical protein